MKFRYHRGQLDDSMATMIEVADRAAMCAAIRKEFGTLGPDFADDDIKVSPYYGDDDRIGWKDVRIVFLPDYGVIGFCEGPA